MDKIYGTVKFFDKGKGFGFIAPDAGGSDVFVHISALKKSGCPELSEGDKVSFLVTRGKKGKDEASSVALLS